MYIVKNLPENINVPSEEQEMENGANTSLAQ